MKPGDMLVAAPNMSFSRESPYSIGIVKELIRGWGRGAVVVWRDGMITRESIDDLQVCYRVVPL